MVSLLGDFAAAAAHEFFEHEVFDGLLLQFLGCVVRAGEAEDAGFAGVDEVADDEHGADERFAGADAAGDVEFEDGAGVGDALEGEFVEEEPPVLRDPGAFEGVGFHVGDDFFAGVVEGEGGGFGVGKEGFEGNGVDDGAGGLPLVEGGGELGVEGGRHGGGQGLRLRTRPWGARRRLMERVLW